MTDAQLLDRARDWLAEDPDPDTRSELTEVLRRAESEDQAALADLADRFTGRLEFGTAGLRGPLGAGPNRMNRATVIRAAAGLAAYLTAHGASGGVVVGYDARHKSEEFARDTAAVMRGAGIEACVLPAALPTPVLAFAIRHLGCAAGVMVTASHNPPQDNGYKVYLGDGSQIVPPADTAISDRIDEVGPVSGVPVAADWQQLDDSVLDDYLSAVAAVVAAANPRGLRIVYTPVHGVGSAVVERVLHDAGFTDVHIVAQQAAPDPDFSTVAFPNPEEPGVIDLAVELAEAVDADVVLANDPDADRCAVAVPRPHGWRMLRGDEVGALLADDLLRRGEEGVFAASIVSSSLLGAMAHRHDRPYQETLTGFKWIARVEGLRFGYEEALGYCVAPEIARDKDGISALLLVADLAARLRSEGSALQDRLDAIATEYGLYATDQMSVRVSDLSVIADAMCRLRGAPPTTLGGFAVEQVEDLAVGVGGLPPTDGLRYRLADRARVVVRPSGTEPKLKAYLEVVVPVTDGVDAARIAAVGRLDAIRADLSAAVGV
ncbi:MAG TPA: phospho-sugar mutase [Nocardioidaceae bacterium]|nr:phospho-sugar mutase [Nocardioidaceae bacterium]